MRCAQIHQALFTERSPTLKARVDELIVSSRLSLSSVDISQIGRLQLLYYKLIFVCSMFNHVYYSLLSNDMTTVDVSYC